MTISRKNIFCHLWVLYNSSKQQKLEIYLVTTGSPAYGLVPNGHVFLITTGPPVNTGIKKHVLPSLSFIKFIKATKLKIYLVTTGSPAWFGPQRPSFLPNNWTTSDHWHKKHVLPSLSFIKFIKATKLEIYLVTLVIKFIIESNRNWNSTLWQLDRQHGSVPSGQVFPALWRRSCL